MGTDTLRDEAVAREAFQEYKDAGPHPYSSALAPDWPLDEVLEKLGKDGPAETSDKSKGKKRWVNWTDWVARGRQANRVPVVPSDGVSNAQGASLESAEPERTAQKEQADAFTAEVNAAAWEDWARLKPDRTDEFQVVGDRIVGVHDAGSGRRRGAHREAVILDGTVLRDDQGRPMVEDKSGKQKEERRNGKMAGHRQKAEVFEKEERRGRESSWGKSLAESRDDSTYDLPQHTMDGEEEAAYAELFGVRENESQVEAQRIARETDKAWYERYVEKAMIPIRQLTAEESVSFREAFGDGWGEDEELSDDDRQTIRRTEQFVSRRVGERRQAARVAQGLNRLPDSAPRQHDRYGTRRGSHKGEGEYRSGEPRAPELPHLPAAPRFDRKHDYGNARGRVSNGEIATLPYERERTGDRSVIERMREAVEYLRRDLDNLEKEVEQLNGEGAKSQAEEEGPSRYMTQEQRDSAWEKSDSIHHEAMERVAAGFPDPDVLTTSEREALWRLPHNNNLSGSDLKSAIRQEMANRRAERVARISRLNPGMNPYQIGMAVREEKRREAMEWAMDAVERDPGILDRAREAVIREHGYDDTETKSRMAMDITNLDERIIRRQDAELAEKDKKRVQLNTDERALLDHARIVELEEMLSREYAYLGWDKITRMAYDQVFEINKMRGAGPDKMTHDLGGDTRPDGADSPLDDPDWRRRARALNPSPRRSMPGTGWSHR